MRERNQRSHRPTIPQHDDLLAGLSPLQIARELILQDAGAHRGHEWPPAAIAAEPRREEQAGRLEPGTSGEQVGDGEAGIRTRERRDMISRPEDGAEAVGPALRLPADLQGLARQIEDPVLRNTRPCVEGELAYTVVPQRAVGDLDDKERGGRMSFAVTPTISRY